MKILITGISGQLGREFARFTHDITGTYLKNRPDSPHKTVRLDITDGPAVLRLGEDLHPDWVIHLAGETRVDWCEEHPDAARTVNVQGTENIAAMCRAAGAKLLFVTTDGVFDGQKGLYREDDPVNPLNVYSQTKLEAEAAVKSVGGHLLARTSMLYSGAGGNFASWVRQALGRGSISAINDLFCSPTLARELADALMRLIDLDLRGTFHAAGAQRASKYDLVRKYVAALGHDPAIVRPVAAAELRLSAPRPRDSSLDISKIEAAGIRFSDLDGAMRQLA